jgi:hypothetical protein
LRVETVERKGSGAKNKLKKTKQTRKQTWKGRAKTTKVSLVFLYIIINTICCEPRQKQGRDQNNSGKRDNYRGRRLGQS